MSCGGGCGGGYAYINKTDIVKQINFLKYVNEKTWRIGFITDEYYRCQTSRCHPSYMAKTVNGLMKHIDDYINSLYV